MLLLLYIIFNNYNLNKIRRLFYKLNFSIKNKIFLLKIKKIHCFINKKLFNIEIK